MAYLDSGVQPEAMAQEALAELRGRNREAAQRFYTWGQRTWAPYQVVLAACRDMLYPAERQRSNIFLAGSAIKAWAAELKEQRSRAVLEWPRNAGSALVLGLMRSEPVIRVATHGAGAESQALRDEAETFEFASHGILNMLTQNLLDAYEGWDSWMQQVIANMVFTSKAVAMVKVSETFLGSGIATVDAPLCDPSTFYHDWGRSQVKRFLYERFLRKEELLEVLAEQGRRWRQDYSTSKEFAAKKDGDRCSYADFWVQEPDGKGGMLVHESMLVDGEMAFDPIRRNLPRAPFVISSVRFDPHDEIAAPSTQGGAGATMESDSVLHFAEPFMWSVRETVHQIESLMSISYDGAGWDALPMMVENVAQNPIPEEGQQQVGAGKKVTVTEGTRSWAFVTRGGNPLNVDKRLEDLHNILDGRVPRGLINAMAAPGESGILYEREIDQWEKALIPYANSCATMAEQVLSMAWEQFERAGDLRFSVDGKWKSGHMAGKLVLVDFEAKHLPKQRRIRVRMPPMLPRDKYKAVQNAIFAVDNGLMSRVDALDHFVQIENVEELVRRADQDRRAKDPRIMELAMLEDLDIKLQAEERKLLLLMDGSEAWTAQFFVVDVLRRRIARLQQAMLGTPSPREGPLGPRPSPEIQPPEAQGQASPDEQAVPGMRAPGNLRPGVAPNPAAPEGAAGAR